MKIPVYSSTIRRKEMDAVLTCLVSEKLGPGEFYQRLIQQLKDTIPIEAAAAFRSPVIAFEYALRALDIPAGSEIIISALAPKWHYHAVIKFGYIPKIVDVDPETAQMNFEAIAEAIKTGGRLVLIHEPLGYMPDPERIKTLEVPVIEDVSTSFGGFVGESRAGMNGVFAILGLEDMDLVTAGGGALLMASARRESIVLKKDADEAPITDILTDFNAALAFVQIKELARNNEIRKDIHSLFTRSLMQGRHKNLLQSGEGSPSYYSFPVLLSSGVKEVRQYTNRKDIDIAPAFSDSVAEMLGEELSGCIHAKSLLMRCVLFPLYPRLGGSNSSKIAKVLATLP